MPYPLGNDDGSYTGDVQNLMGGLGQNPTTFNTSTTNPTPGGGVQKPDSIWIDLGLQPILWNGKWIKPLVAPLIVDTEGRLNVNAHGNNRNAGKHTSGIGAGPWEVNPNPVQAVNAAALLGENETSGSAPPGTGAYRIVYGRYATTKANSYGITSPQYGTPNSHYFTPTGNGLCNCPLLLW